MSGVCPIEPARNRITFDDTPPVKDANNLVNPNPKGNDCGVTNNTDIVVAPRPDGETITNEVTKCVPGIPGLTGPQGPAGADGADGADGANGLDGAGNVTWRGNWSGEGVQYYLNDFVTHDASSYMSLQEHISTADGPDVPMPVDTLAPSDPQEPTGASEYWILVSYAGEDGTPEEKSFLEGLMDGAMDWMGDIENWGIGDWIGATVAGIGLIWAASELNDMMDQDGEGDGAADSVYAGPSGYTGAVAAPTLVSVIEQLCLYADVTNYDLSQLDNTIQTNFTIGNVTSVRTILEILSRAYHFSMIDSGGTLVFVPVDNTNPTQLLSLDYDLGFVSEGSSLGAPYFVKRLQGNSLPRSIELTYFSKVNAHNEFVQTVPADNGIFTEGDIVRLQLPITLDDTEAYAIAERIWTNTMMERTTYTFTTTTKWIKLEPGDYVELPNVGVLRIIRVDEKNQGLLTFSCTDAGVDREYLNESSGLNASAPPTYTDTAFSTGYSAGVATELPPMDSSDVNPRLNLYPHGFGKAGWKGCSIHTSTDGINYSLLTSTTKESTFGRVATFTPPPSDHTVWDTTTVISVELKTGTLSNFSEQEVLDGKNWCIIGEEIIGFQNAVWQGGTTYLLSNLMRARKGTEFASINHTNDEAFILLDNAMIELPYSFDQAQTTFYVKYVTTGSDISKATAYPMQPMLKSRKPWRPENLTGVQNGAAWTFTWLCRNQFNGTMIDSSTVQKPEGYAGMALSIMNPNNDEVVRTIIQQQGTYVYTEVQQIEDFGSAQSIVKYRLAQIDLEFGIGYHNIQTFGN